MNFDRLAPHYDWIEALTAGARLQRARTHWLDALAGCQNVLSVGEGHGRFAAACLERFPHLRLTCVEASAAMIEVAKRRTRAWQNRVQWENVDALAWRPPKKYDAIVTCFFLDCFPAQTLNVLVSQLADALPERAIWLLTDFAIPASGPARWRAKAVHALMYAFFRIVTKLPARRLNKPDQCLVENGFRRVSRREFEWGLVAAEVWQRGEPTGASDGRSAFGVCTCVANARVPGSV